MGDENINYVLYKLYIIPCTLANTQFFPEKWSNDWPRIEVVLVENLFQIMCIPYIK